jgi:hypothetical protein
MAANTSTGALVASRNWSDWDSVGKFAVLRTVLNAFYQTDQGDSLSGSDNFAYEDKNIAYFRQYIKDLENPNPFSREPKDTGAARYLLYRWFL